LPRSATTSTSPAANGGLLGTIGGREIVRRQGAVVFLLVLVVLNAFITPNFFSRGTLVNTLVQAFPIMLVALGMTMVISSGGIDISVGAIMAIAGVVATRLFTSEMACFNSGLGLALSVGCGIVAGGLCGLFNGALISRWRIQPIVVTLVAMIAGRGLAQTILGKPVVSLFLTPFNTMGTYKVADTVPVQIVIILVAVGVMLFVAKKTVFARHVEALGDNCRAARLVGINTTAVTIGVYVLCGVLCAVAGIMEAARTGGANAKLLGLNTELDAIAAVAIGGTPFTGGRARVFGTVTGAIVVQLVTVIVNMNDIQFHYSLIFKALIVVVALCARGMRRNGE
jgi:galactofuranose transport system permease protein